MSVDGNHEGRVIEDKITEEDKIYVMVSSPVIGFAMAVNHYIKLGYEPCGDPVSEVQFGVITMHQGLVNKTKLNKHLEWYREREEILHELEVIRNDLQNTREELRMAKLDLYSIPGARSFFRNAGNTVEQTVEEIKKERELKLAECETRHQARLEKIGRVYTFGDFIEWLFGKKKGN